MELQQVRYFRALAHSLNFTRAAEQCNVTQPALTRAIQKLEFELGGALIHRERNLTQLTQLGHLVLPMFERTLAAAEAALLHAAEYRNKQIAPLKIGLGSGVAANITARPLFEVSKTVPGLSIELVDTPVDKIFSSLLEGAADVAIACDASPATCDRFDRWRLFEEPFVVLMPSDHPLAVHDIISLDQLSDVNWLDFAGCDARPMACERGNGPDTKYAIAHRASQAFQLLPLVAAGMGLMLAPQHMPLIHGIVAKFVDDPHLRRRVCLISVAGRRHPASLDAFIKIMRTRDWTRDLGIREKPAPAAGEELASVA